MLEAAPGSVRDRMLRIRESIAQAAARAGRKAEDICLVAVSKRVEVARVQEALAAGIADLGENYVQEATEKQKQITGPARWHLIGHLQSNKAAQAVAIFDIVHTVDTPRVGRALGRQAEGAGKVVDVLLQVNTSGEGTKHGVTPEQTDQLLEAVLPVPGLRVRGLMTIGRWDPDPERARPEFRLLARRARELERRFGLEPMWLSMGMSHDFEVAIEEGATLVRIGTGVFGPRPE